MKRSFELYKNSLTKNEKLLRLILIVTGEAISAFTLFYLVSKNNFDHLKMAVISLFIVLVPAAVEVVFRCRMMNAVYIAADLYALCPLFGECYDFYNKISWWDKMLHTFGGLAFALFGAYLFRLMCKDEQGRIAAALFALCFSMSLSVLWEFVEYAGDSLFGMDMQKDTVVTELHSYYLGEDPSTVGAIREIDSVTVNGEEMPFDGYLDIGLNDTMQDMLVETAGALVAATAILINKSRMFIFIPFSEETLTACEDEIKEECACLP